MKLGFVLQNLFYFQVPSVVPLIVMPTASMVLMFLAIFLAEYFLLQFSKLRQVLNLLLFPVVVVACCAALSVIAPRLGLDASLVGLPSTAVIAWQIVLLVLVIGFLLERFNPISYLSYRLYLLAHQSSSSGGGMVHGIVQRSIVVPLFDEAVFRYFAINSLVLAGLTPYAAVCWSAVAYGLAHWSQWHNKQWAGASSINTGVVLGFLLGIIAIKYGILASFGYHVASNILYSVLDRFKPASD